MGEECLGEPQHGVEVSSMLRRTFSHPASPKRPRQPAPALFTSRSRLPCSDSSASATPGGSLRLGQVRRDDGRAAQLVRERLQAVLATGDEDQPGIRLAREAPGRRLADAARRSGDQGNHGRSLIPGHRCIQDPLADQRVTAHQAHSIRSSGPGFRRISSGLRSCRCRAAPLPGESRRARRARGPGLLAELRDANRRLGAVPLTPSLPA